MRKRYLAMLLAVTTIFSQITANSITVTATEYPAETTEETEIPEETEESGEISTETDTLEADTLETEAGATECSALEETACVESSSTEVTESAASEVTEDSETVFESETIEESETAFESEVIEEPETVFFKEVSEIETDNLKTTESSETLLENKEDDGINPCATRSGDEWSISILGPDEVGLRQEDDCYTWLYVGESQTFTADIVNPTDGECTLTWEVGTMIGDNFTPITSQDGAFSYQVSDDTLTLTGASEAGDFAIHATVTQEDSDTELDAWVHFDVRNEVYDYQLPVGDDISQLPYWNYDISKEFNYYVENPEYPYGENFTGTITSVEVANAADDEGDGNAAVIYEWDDGNGWNISMERFGHAIGTLTYTTYNGQNTQKTFNIWIGTDVYSINIGTSTGVENALPGESIDLSASLNHECYSEEDGTYQGSIEGVTYEWIIEDENCTEDIVAITQDSTNPEILHLDVVDKEENMGWNIPVAVRAYMPGDNGNEEVAYQNINIFVCGGYYRLEPIDLDTYELGIGDTITITPTMYYHCYGQEVQTVTDKQQYRLEWDTNAIQITDKSGKILTNGNAIGTAPFTLKKLENWTTGINLIAELPDEEGNYSEVTRRFWDFYELNYDVWFNELRGGEWTWLYKGNTTGEEIELPLEIGNLEGKNYSIEWEVGLTDEEGNYTYSIPTSNGAYTLNTEKTTITLKANKLWDALAAKVDGEPEDIWFNVRAIVKAGGKEVSRAETGVQLRKEVYDYHFPVNDDVAMLPYWDCGFNKNFDYHVEDKDNIDGADFKTTITNVTVENASDDAGEGNVITLSEWDDGSGYNFHAERYGHAVATIIYTKHDGSSGEKIINIWVGNEVYNLNILSDTGMDIVVPGESITLTGELDYDCYDEEQGHYKGSIDGLTYEWVLEDENCKDIMTMTTDDSNPTVLNIDVTNSESAMNWNIPVSLRVYRETEEVIRQDFNIYVGYDYYAISPVYLEDTSLEIGETVTITPKLYYHCFEKETAEVTENLQWRLEWDENAIEVTNNGSTLSGGNATVTAPFTMKKLQNYQTGVNLLAELPNDNGDYEEKTRRAWDFYEVDYSTWFEDLRGDGYTWIYKDDASGETYEVALAKDNITGKSCDITWQVGLCDEDGNFTYNVTESATTYTVNSDKTAVTLYANGLWDKLSTQVEDGSETLWFQVRATISIGDIELSVTDTSVEIRNEVCDYSVPQGEVGILPKWKFLILKSQNVYVENPEYPYGKDFDIEITSITVENAADDEGEGDVAVIEEWEGGNGWNIRAARLGHAVVTITYNTKDGTTAVNTLDIYVNSELYMLDVWSDTGTCNVLPGGSLDLTADIVHYCYNEDDGMYEGTTDNLTYEWTLADENCNDIVTLEEDSENPKVLHVSINSENSNGWCIPIDLRVYTDGDNGKEEVAYLRYEIYVNEVYYQAVSDTIIAAPGERVELPVELRRISLDAPDGIVMQDASFRMESYTDLIVVDESGLGAEIATGIVTADSEPEEVAVHIYAQRTDENGDEICEETDATVIVCEHQYEQTASTPSTCTKQGTITYECKKCEHEKIEKQPLAAHTPVTDKAVAATCTKTGLTEGSHCSVCNKVLTAQQTTKALGHDYKDQLTEAEIGKAGKIESVCTRCKNIASTTAIAAISTVELSNTSFTYNGKVCKPSVTVKDKKGKTLAANTAYTVSYSDGCKNPGKYTVTVTFKGNYKGTKELTYTIVPKGVAISSLTAEKKGFTAKWKKGTAITGYELQYSTSSKFTGSSTKTKTISKSGTTSQKISSLKETKKYYVRVRTYKTIKVNSKETKLYSDWSDTVTVITKDKKDKLSAVKSVKLSETKYIYNGKAKKPTVTVKDKAGNILEQNTDYTVSYSSGCKKPGQYTVTVKFKGNYSTTKKKTLTFTIVPKSVSISKVSAASKGFKVTWKKGSEITGYEIQYSTSSKFSKKTTKTVTVSSSKATSKAISKLSAKKKYYVRIRTYKTVKINGKSTKLYSDWSKASTVKTKK